MVSWAMDINRDPCCCRDMNPDMALDSSLGWDITLASLGSKGYSNQGIPYSPVLLLFVVPKPFCFSLSPISLPYTCSSQWLLPFLPCVAVGGVLSSVFCLLHVLSQIQKSVKFDLIQVKFMKCKSKLLFWKLMKLGILSREMKKKIQISKQQKQASWDKREFSVLVCLLFQ